MPPDLSGRRAEVEGGEERPEILSIREKGGGCCGFPNAKSEEDPTFRCDQQPLHTLATLRCPRIRKIIVGRDKVLEFFSNIRI